MTIDHNRELILSSFSRLQEHLQRHELNDPIVYRSLLFIERQLRGRPHHSVPRDDLLCAVYAFFESAQVQQALLAAREWQKKDSELNKERNRQKSLAALEYAKKHPAPSSRPSILGKNGILAFNQAKPVSAGAAKAVGLLPRKTDHK